MPCAGMPVDVIEENWVEVVDGIVGAVLSMVVAPALLGLPGFDSDTVGEWAAFIAVGGITGMLYLTARRLVAKFLMNRR